MLHLCVLPPVDDVEIGAQRVAPLAVGLELEAVAVGVDLVVLFKVRIGVAPPSIDLSLSLYSLPPENCWLVVNALVFHCLINCGCNLSAPHLVK